MGMTVAPRARYENAIKTLFPQGAYWDDQFADPNSDISLFAKAKLDELIRFRGRMSGLQDESRIETTDELIADWERVLLDELNYDKSLTERRLLLKSKEDNKLNRAELQKIASMFGFTIAGITFPYRPAFFGHTRFNGRAGGPAVFSVLLFTVEKTGLFSECWELIKAEYPSKQFGFLRFGIDRLAYFPIYKRREIILACMRSSGVGSMRFGTARLFPLDIEAVMSVVYEKLSAGRFGTMYFSCDRIMEFDNGFRNDLTMDKDFYSGYINKILRKANFQNRFEYAFVRYIINDKNLFSEFEQAIKNKLLANQISYFKYEGV